MPYRNRFFAAAIIATCVATAVPGARQARYARIADIPVGGAASFDYLNVDSAAHRLYLTHATEVVVIDTVSNAVVGRIPAGPRVHGIVITPGGRGFITNGGDNSVSVVDLDTLKVVGKVPAQANPDAIAYDPARNAVYAFNHTGKSATVIDAKTSAVIATIPLSGTAETGQVDPALGRVYVNIEDKSAVDVIDAVSHKVIATWPVSPAEEPTGMAIDTTSHRLFIGGGPNVVMMDGRTGKVLSSLPICAGTDATSFDAAAGLVFSSCGGGAGAITVGRVSGTTLAAAQTIETTRGARTMALDSMTHRLYVAGQTYGTAGPVADSFHVLVFGLP